MKTFSLKLGKSALNTAFSLVVVTVLWVFALWAFDVSPYIGKNPLDVFNFLFTVDTASENQVLVATALGQTMYDASIGFAVGITLASLIAVLFALSKVLSKL